MKFLIQSKSGFILLVVLILVSSLVSACSSTAESSDMAGMNMVPLASLPHEVQSAPESVQNAYRFAAANPDLLKGLPCYCGCGSIGHTSNYDCYVTEEDNNGTLHYDNHALGCSICVDITLDAARMQKEGKSLPEIHLAIDETYSKFGPSNMLP